MDIGPGGVQIVEPSQTALKYLTDHAEEELPFGAHLRSRRIMEGLRGHRLSRKDLEESFQKFSDEKMNGKKEDLRPTTCSGLPSSNVRRQKPGAGIGWTEPRNEKAIGFMDIRKTLRGYIGGVKIRESLFAEV